MLTKYKTGVKHGSFFGKPTLWESFENPSDRSYSSSFSGDLITSKTVWLQSVNKFKHSRADDYELTYQEFIFYLSEEDYILGCLKYGH